MDWSRDMLPRLNGADIPYGWQCQRGTCANRLLEGEVECPDGVDPGWKAAGYVLAWVMRASGDVRLEA